MLILPTHMLSDEWYGKAQAQLTLWDLDALLLACGIAAAGGTPAGDFDLVPDSVPNLPVGITHELGQIRADVLPLRVYNSALVKREPHLLLALGADGGVAGSALGVAGKERLESFDLLRSGASPVQCQLAVWVAIFY